MELVTCWQMTLIVFPHHSIRLCLVWVCVLPLLIAGRRFGSLAVILCYERWNVQKLWKRLADRCKSELSSSGLADRCLFSAELRWASVWSEELAAVLPLPVLVRPGSWNLLHHLSALHSLEPGSFPVPTPRQHVDGKSHTQNACVGDWCVCVWEHVGPPQNAQTQVFSLMSGQSTKPPLFSLRVCLLLFTFQPPFIPFPLQWPVSDTILSTYPQAWGATGASVTRD